jgi:hypothetical protein
MSNCLLLQKNNSKTMTRSLTYWSYLEFDGEADIFHGEVVKIRDSDNFLLYTFSINPYILSV